MPTRVPRPGRQRRGSRSRPRGFRARRVSFPPDRHTPEWRSGRGEAPEPSGSARRGPPRPQDAPGLRQGPPPRPLSPSRVRSPGDVHPPGTSAHNRRAVRAYGVPVARTRFVREWEKKTLHHSSPPPSAGPSAGPCRAGSSSRQRDPEATRSRSGNSPAGPRSRGVTRARRTDRHLAVAPSHRHESHPLPDAGTGSGWRVHAGGTALRRGEPQSLPPGDRPTRVGAARGYPARPAKLRCAV